MDCLICANLERAYEARLSEYVEHLGMLSGQHATCSQEKCRYGARPIRIGRAPVGMRSKTYRNSANIF
jgi:hypothetical protein